MVVRANFVEGPAIVESKDRLREGREGNVSRSSSMGAPGPSEVGREVDADIAGATRGLKVDATGVDATTGGILRTGTSFDVFKTGLTRMVGMGCDGAGAR